MSQPKAKKTTVTGAAKWIDILFAAAVLGHLPIGYEYYRRMWSVGHYQFFPLVLIAASWMVVARLVESQPKSPKTQLSYWLLLTDLVLLASAALMFSPFIWILSLILLIVIYIYDR